MHVVNADDVRVAQLPAARGLVVNVIQRDGIATDFERQEF